MHEGPEEGPEDGPADSPERDADRVIALFTRSDGSYRFARWGRPLVPAIFGVPEHAEAAMRETIGAVAGLAGLPVEEEDPELGANFLVFLCHDWAELRGVPGLPKLVPDIQRLTTVLEASGANQYRIFGFEGDRDPARKDEPGAIRICITLLRLDDDLGRFSWHALALSQAVLGLLLWSDHAFLDDSPIAEFEGTDRAVVKPWVQGVVRAAYSPMMPDAATDPAHGQRLARLTT